MDYLNFFSEKYNLNRETSKHDHLLLFNEQLNGQITEYYKYAYEEAANTHYWYYPADYNDGLAPHDAGICATTLDQQRFIMTVLIEIQVKERDL